MNKTWHEFKGVLKKKSKISITNLWLHRSGCHELNYMGKSKLELQFYKIHSSLDQFFFRFYWLCFKSKSTIVDRPWERALLYFAHVLQHHYRPSSPHNPIAF